MPRAHNTSGTAVKARQTLVAQHPLHPELPQDDLVWILGARRAPRHMLRWDPHMAYDLALFFGALAFLELDQRAFTRHQLELFMIINESTFLQTIKHWLSWCILSFAFVQKPHVACMFCSHPLSRHLKCVTMMNGLRHHSWISNTTTRNQDDHAEPFVVGNGIYMYLQALNSRWAFSCTDTDWMGSPQRLHVSEDSPCEAFYSGTSGPACILDQVVDSQASKSTRLTWDIAATLVFLHRYPKFGSIATTNQKDIMSQTHEMLWERCEEAEL